MALYKSCIIIIITYSVVTISSGLRAASDVYGAITLVQHHILWIELSCRWTVQCINAITDCRRLHWPI